MLSQGRDFFRFSILVVCEKNSSIHWSRNYNVGICFCCIFKKLNTASWCGDSLEWTRLHCWDTQSLDCTVKSPQTSQDASGPDFYHALLSVCGFCLTFDISVPLILQHIRENVCFFHELEQIKIVPAILITGFNKWYLIEKAKLLHSPKCLTKCMKYIENYLWFEPWKVYNLV